jgi:hypothetical protein
MSCPIPSPDGRYAAKLLFQTRFEDDKPGGFRTVEERILLIQAKTADVAYKAAVKRGREGTSTFTNDAGAKVFIEFVGITDLMSLGPEVESDEVWYEIRRMKDPMRRKSALVPRKADLSAIRIERRHRTDPVPPTGADSDRPHQVSTEESDARP